MPGDLGPQPNSGEHAVSHTPGRICLSLTEPSPLSRASRPFGAGERSGVPPLSADVAGLRNAVCRAQIVDSEWTSMARNTTPTRSESALTLPDWGVSTRPDGKGPMLEVPFVVL